MEPNHLSGGQIGAAESFGALILSLTKHMSAALFSGAIIFALNDYLQSLTHESVESYPYLVDSQETTRRRILGSFDNTEFAAYFARRGKESSLEQLSFQEAALRSDERITALLAVTAEDKSSPFRLQALQALSNPSHLQRAEAQQVFRNLLQAEETPAFRLYAARMLSQADNSSDTISFLQRKLSDETSSVVAAALIHAIEQLQLRSSSTSPSYL